MHEIILETHAERDLRKFPPDIANRIIAALESLRLDPRGVGCRKLAGSKRDWRKRVGDYRIIYEIDDPSAVIRVMFIRHRREAYR